MILQSRAEFRFSQRPLRAASRLGIGTAMLGSVVALLALLNLLAGTA